METTLSALKTSLAPAPLALLLALACVSGPAAAQEQTGAGSRSVFGANAYLSDGATALMLGQYEKGVELTQLGLKDVLTTEERVTSLSNLCAGYVGLKEFDVALVYCNRSLQMDPNNWRALQNRAAAYAGIGYVEKALSDVEQGLTLNPNSEALKLTLSIVREQAKRMARPGSSSTRPPVRTNLPVEPGTSRMISSIPAAAC
jgi:tetratricopeptide (TPR) repeat protein